MRSVLLRTIGRSAVRHALLHSAAMMNSVLQAPLSLASDNPFCAEQECIDHIGAQAHHSSFAAGVPEQLRRDSALAPPTLSSLASRYGTHRADSTYQSGVALSDSGSGSISASPRSNASSALAYSYASLAPTGTTTYPNHYLLPTNFSGLTCGYGNSMASTRRMSLLNDASTSAMLPPARSPGLGNPVSPSMGATARDNYTTSTPGLHRHPHTLSHRHSDISRYNPLPETPRSLLPTTMPITAYNGYSSGGYGGHSNSSETPPFNAQDNYGTITCEGTPVTPTIDAKIEKGFFVSGDRVWTCYRRNYFAVNVSFGLSPWISNARLYLDQGNGTPQEQIQSMAVSLAAAVDGTTGKTIELIQHTPKRDKGPQLSMKKELLAPTPPGKNPEHGGYGINGYHQSSTVPGPQLPLQNEGDSSQQFSPTSHANNTFQHSFERIQFKSATANNGKRRAQQQYYHLIIELWANIQNPRESEPRWVKVACRSSHPVVVRGRSPSHYQNEGPHNATTPRGTPGSGLGGPGHHGPSSNGRTSYSSYSNGLSGSGASGMSGSMYRGNTYSLDPSPVGSHSVSSASSLSGGPAEGLVGEDDEVKMIDTPHDYSYYPTPLYENMASKLEATLPQPERKVKEEYAGPPSIATGWQVGGCGRFQGMESSRGYYPDVHAHIGY